MYRILVLLFVFSCFSCKKELMNTHVVGEVFGTSFSIKYEAKQTGDFQKQFDSLFRVINKSMSTYIKDSDISKINRNEDSLVDSHFINVFKASEAIYKETDGVFDPTIGALVNAWDFGPEGTINNLDSLKIDSLMLSVGLDKVTLIGNKISKPKGTFIDFNAIAKGYGVDVIGIFLESQGIENYLVEIGGEIRSRGINVERNAEWKVGVEMPHFDGTQSILKAISIRDESMATSGTYRKFKVDEQGNRYAHIIDPITGYPSKTNLLSISVIAKDCMTADAYATALKAMGIDKVKAFLDTHNHIKVLAIIQNEHGDMETIFFNGFPED
jgi:thiamine biosynthesis lipoprotein